MNKAKICRYILIVFVLFISFSVIDLLVSSSVSYIKNICLIIVVIIMALINQLFLSKNKNDNKGE